MTVDKNSLIRTIFLLIKIRSSYERRITTLESGLLKTTMKGHSYSDRLMRRKTTLDSRLFETTVRGQIFFYQDCVVLFN